MSDKELIKQEIERRIVQAEEFAERAKGANDDSSKLSWDFVATQNQSLLQFIDSLPEEPASEDLKKEISKWRNHYLSVLDNNLRIDLRDIEVTANHFAEWQKKKDQETIELAEDHAMLAGMNRMKEEMMKDAVDAFVNTYENTDDSNYVEFVTEQSPYKFKETEKCKLIIVKEHQ